MRKLNIGYAIVNITEQVKADYSLDTQRFFEKT